MKTIGTVLCGCSLAVMTGCAPQLAQTPLGQQEEEWRMSVKDAYPEWEAPKTLPPVQRLDNQSTFAQDSVVENTPGIVESEPPAFEAVADVMDTPDPAAALTILEDDDVVSDGSTHIVVKGDSLWKISQRYYATGAKWRMIFDANKDLLTDPNSLKPGMELRIPQ